MVAGAVIVPVASALRDVEILYFVAVRIDHERVAELYLYCLAVVVDCVFNEREAHLGVSCFPPE